MANRTRDKVGAGEPDAVGGLLNGTTVLELRVDRR